MWLHKLQYFSKSLGGSGLSKLVSLGIAIRHPLWLSNVRRRNMGFDLKEAYFTDALSINFAQELSPQVKMIEEKNVLTPVPCTL